MGRRFGVWWSDVWLPIVVVVVFVAMLGGLAYSIYSSVQSENHFVRQCHDQGGHTVDVSRSKICVGSDGRYLGQE